MEPLPVVQLPTPPALRLPAYLLISVFPDSVVRMMAHLLAIAVPLMQLPELRAALPPGCLVEHLGTVQTLLISDAARLVLYQQSSFYKQWGSISSPTPIQNL